MILFGSRARGDTHETSDWDICVVGGGHEPQDVEGTLYLEDYPDEDTRVDVLWRHRDALRHDTSAGTVWADVVNHGRVLAGDENILADIRITPMKQSDIVRAFETSASKMHTASTQTLAAATGSAHRQRLANSEGMEASGAAAEHLTRALMGLVRVQPASGHHVLRNADLLREIANTTRNERHARALRAVAHTIARTNGRTRSARGVGYHGRTETRKEWEARIREVARGCAEIMQAALERSGPLADTMHLPHARKIRETAARAAQTTRDTCRAVADIDTTHLAPETARALDAWRRALEARPTTRDREGTNTREP